MLKKSYKGFAAWLIAFIAALLALGLMPTPDIALLMRLILLLMAWGIAALAFIIWRTEQVYWCNGTSYEEAEAAGSERRKEFAWKHLRLFGGYALGLSMLVSVMHLLGVSPWVDFTVGTGGLIAAGCCTMTIKL